MVTSSQEFSGSTTTPIDLSSSTSSSEVVTSTSSEGSSSSTTVSSSETSSNSTPSPTCDLPTPGIAAAAGCPANDGLVFTTDDGSEWMLVCNRDYGGSDLQAFGSQSMSECINSCNTVSGCVGVSYISGDEQDTTHCWTKYDMNPSLQSLYTVHSAVRIRGPRTGPSPSQRLKNGCFESDLSDWSDARPGDLVLSQNFVWNQGAA